MRTRAVVREDGKRYESVADAARDIGGNVNGTSRNIIHVCQGKASHAYGYRWRYEDGEFSGKPMRRREPAPTGRYGISGMCLSHDEWRAFNRLRGERGLLMREAGAEAIRMWIDANGR